VRALVAIVFISSMGCNSILGISDPVAGDTPGDGNPGDAGPRVLQSITIEPDPLLVPLGLTKQLEARGHFSDGTTEDLTAQASFALVSGSSMTVTAGGQVKALTEGPATISALVGVFTDMIDAAVSTAAPDHITLSLGDLTLRQQQRVQVRATIVFTDGATAEGTDSVTWASSDSAIASVVGGLVDAQLVMGAATISASLPSVTAGTLIANVGVIRCHPIINEVQAGSNASAADEWAEVFNPCTVAIDVSTFTLNYRAANDGIAQPDRNFLIQLAGTMQPGELRLYGGNMVPETLTATWGNGVMQANNGGLGLRDGPTTTGILVDSVTYGNVNGNPFTETATTMPLDATSVIARRPFDGNDTDNNSVNFVKIPIIASSPGVLNVP
jgi:Bacterial Ig-like domain (group 2)